MALIFSLSAAVLAILVQQWVHDYMYTFLRYSSPLKTSRVRQYLYEGVEGWYMPAVADSVPGLFHVSVFLFFVGLVDSILNINTTVGLVTTVPIGIFGLLYIFITFAPVIHPQSPYQSGFSSLVWFLVQKLHPRTFKDGNRGFRSLSVSTNIAQGQLQLSMEKTPGRKDRDWRAIQWLVEFLTEDAEIELLAMTIPGSFNGKWGSEVWNKLLILGEDIIPQPALYFC
jgi:hypothetical protein